MKQIQDLFSKTRLFFTVSLLIGLSSLTATANIYEVDPSHSTVLFRAKHLGASHFYGRFNELSGAFTIDENDPAKSKVEIEVRAESVDTFNERRDQHLKSPDFFNAKQFPVITFKSKAVNKLEADTYEVTGDFFLHGVTKTLTVKVKQTGVGKNRRGNQLIGFETTFTIKRSEFGMNYMLDGVSDEVSLIISLEAASQ
ncbi:YceI family protein [Candidatus Poribacteria bacterium]|nr:YceI family protein [Candidatus Poribacteria bacterium]